VWLVLTLEIPVSFFPPFHFLLTIDAFPLVPGTLKCSNYGNSIPISCIGFPPLPVLGERGRSGIGTRIEEYKENDATFGVHGIDRLVVEIDASEHFTEEGRR